MSRTPIPCIALSAALDTPLYHAGPPLERGPLPSIFYFALSGPDTLTVDPFNQPVQFLADQEIRFFSMTLPAHEHPLSPHDAIAVWAEEMGRGIDCLGQFLEKVQIGVNFAIREGFADRRHLAVAGLSRGGLIATHAAARDSRFRLILQFAPLTNLGLAKEFRELADHPLVRSYSAENVAPSLAGRPARFYIGNRDTRVSTRSCFAFSERLTEEAHQAGFRSPPVELILSPSIGHQGHGTTPEIFRQGALWLKEGLIHGR